MTTVTQKNIKVMHQMAEQRAAVNWYAKIVTYLLNRAENLPLEIKDLIQEASHERAMKYGTRTLKEHAEEKEKERKAKATK